MVFQTETQQRIAATAELFRERVRRGHTACDGSSEPELPNEVLEEWRTAVSSDNEFGDYLAFASWPDDEPLPNWVETLDSLTRYVVQEYDQPEAIPTTEPVPFVHVFWPIAEFARRSLLDVEITEILHDGVIEQFQLWLVDRLHSLGAQALHVDFIRYIAERDTAVITEDRRIRSSTEWYDAYVQAVLNGRLTSVFSEFAVFARRLVRLCEQWAAAVAEFVHRLEADWEQLCETFDTDATAVTGLSAALGDHHNNGRSVLTVQFDTGTEIVYKPRSITTQQKLQSFIEACEAFDSFPTLARCELLARRGYGWVEKVASPRFTADEIEEYYRRAGGLLMVLYLLHGTDYHFENIIAVRTSPLVIDNETILHQELPLQELPLQELPRERLGGRVLEATIRSSVLKTLLLPFWRMHLQTTRTVEAGLGFVTPEETTERLVWTDINTDAMDIAYEQKETLPKANAPSTDGGIVPPSEAVSEILTGFESAYRAILTHRTEVKEVIMELFSDCESRNLIQSTRTYQAAFDTLTTPANLRDGIAHDATMTRYEQKAVKMTAVGSVSVENPSKWLVRDAEYRALLAGDVPRFTTKANERHLYFNGDCVLEDAFNQTGIEAARNRLQQLSIADMRRQQSLIRACLCDRSVAENTDDHR